MNKKTLFLIKHTLRTKFFNKTFLITNIIIFILMLAVTNIGNIVNLFDNKSEQIIYLIDNTDDESLNIHNQIITLKDSIKDHLDADYSNIVFETDKEIINKEDDYSSLVNDNENLVIEFIKVDGKVTSKYYSNEEIGQNMTNILSYFHSNVYFDSVGINPNLPDVIKEIIIDSNNKDFEQMLRIIIPLISVLPISMFILLGMNFIGGEIVEEKESKIIEIILSNVKASNHFFSKLVAVTIGFISQIILIAIFGFIGFIVSSIIGSSMTGEISSASSGIDIQSIIDFYPNMFLSIIFIAIFSVLAIVIYLLIAGALAANSSNMQDLNKVFSPLIIFSSIGMYLAFVTFRSDNVSTIYSVLSFIPIAGLSMAPSAFFFNDISLIQIIIIFAINLFIILILFKSIIRVYKESILNFSDEGPFKMLIKSFKRQKKEKKTKK